MNREPVVLVDLARAIIVLLVAFGVPVTANQTDAIVGLVAIVATFGIGAWLTRRLVTPVASPVLDTGTAVTTPDGGNAVVTKASPNY